MCALEHLTPVPSEVKTCCPHMDGNGTGMGTPSRVTARLLPGSPPGTSSGSGHFWSLISVPETPGNFAEEEQRLLGVHAHGTGPTHSRALQPHSSLLHPTGVCKGTNQEGHQHAAGRIELYQSLPLPGMRFVTSYLVSLHLCESLEQPGDVRGRPSHLPVEL